MVWGGGWWRGRGRMRIMRRVAAGVCALIAAGLGVAACADRGTRPGGTLSASGAWVTYEAEVSGVTSGPGAEAVTVHVKALAGRDGCSRNVRVGYHEEENGVIFANIVQDS